MRTYVLIVLALAGSYYFITRKVKLDEPLAYSAKYKNSSWAPAANYYIGLAYYQRSDYPRAQEAFTQLLGNHATSYYAPQGLMYLADAAEENRDYATAKEALARYLEEYPEGKEKDRAAKKLELLRYRHGQ